MTKKMENGKEENQEHTNGMISRIILHITKYLKKRN